MFSQATAQGNEHTKLSELTPYPQNPRRSSDARIAGSIAARTIQSPDLVDADTSIAEGVRLPTRDIGLHTVPVIAPYRGEHHAN